MLSRKVKYFLKSKFIYDWIYNEVKCWLIVSLCEKCANGHTFLHFHFLTHKVTNLKCTFAKCWRYLHFLSKCHYVPLIELSISSCTRYIHASFKHSFIVLSYHGYICKFWSMLENNSRKLPYVGCVCAFLYKLRSIVKIMA